MGVDQARGKGSIHLFQVGEAMRLSFNGHSIGVGELSDLSDGAYAPIKR